MKKEWLIRENIPEVGRTIIEKIEYWLYKKGLIFSQRLFCKWYKTLVQETLDDSEISSDDIKIIKTKPPQRY